MQVSPRDVIMTSYNIIIADTYLTHIEMCSNSLSVAISLCLSAQA